MLIFLIIETLELCGYVILRPKSGRKGENKIAKQLLTYKHFALAKKQSRLISNLFLNTFSSLLTVDPLF